MVRAHILFRGTVQGVGFRFTTLSFAKELSLTGWVKNLADGRVEALVEGPRLEIEELMARLKNEFGAYIHEHRVKWMENKGEFREFYIER